MSARPRWLAELERLVPIRAQFILAGNIRDHFLMPDASEATLVPLLRSLWQGLSALGYRFVAVYDPVDGVRVYPPEDAAREAARTHLQLSAEPQPIALEALAQLAGRIAALREARCALVLDYASRIQRNPNALDAAEHRFFVAAQKLSLAASPIVAPGSAPAFNPIIWLVNREQDLPSWFALDSERIATLAIPEPDYEARAAAAGALGALFEGYAAADASARARFSSAFASATDGLSLAAMTDVAQLAAAQRLDSSRVEDAVRCFKVGALDNPWRKDYLRERIRGAASAIERRVQGQRRAVTKTVDILMRSVMGLTGAQARASGNRPRGVLFFAGPTGVGKTELAKTLTEIVFGDERAYIRFDMSEFAAEHAAARLLGAPPGYVGYDSGGELTNAVRERPFAVILFDEIEKAHPRILDKFLQILEDGRLTDGRGQTAYFSEAIIVFTSNLGIFVEDASGARVQSVTPADGFETVEARVTAAIGDYFKFRLLRPEILNRIGDNIVVFDFIRPEVAARIFDAMLENVVRRVQSEHQIALTIAPAVREELRALCTADLAHGGRGIGNRLESMFVNPLARALFAATAGPARNVSALEEQDGVRSVVLA